MILFEARTLRQVNVSELENKIAQALKENRDERIIKPKKVKISEIDQESTHNGILVNGHEDIDKRVASCNGRILWSKEKYAEGERAGYDAVFRPVFPETATLIHQAPIYYVAGNGTIYTNLADKFLENKAIGDIAFTMKPKELGIIGEPTYLKIAGTDDRDYLGGGTFVFTTEEMKKGNFKPSFALWSFEVSVPELLKTRTIFYDPEGTHVDQEFKKTFMVFGGIPLQAVIRAKINVVHDSSRSI